MSNMWMSGTIPLAHFLLTGALLAQAVRARGPHVDTLEGIVVTDRYRWLERVDDPAVRDWIKSQDSTARALLGALPDRTTADRYIDEAGHAESYSPPVRAGGLLFMTKARTLGGSRELSYDVRDAASGAMRVLLDADQMRTATGRTPLGASPSPDGRMVAYGTAPTTTEWETVRIRDVTTGADLSDSLVGFHRVSGLSWAQHDPAGFYYTRYDRPRTDAEDTVTVAGGNVYFHAVGTSQSADTVVFAAPDRATMVSPAVTWDGQYLVLSLRRLQSRGNAIRVIDLAAPHATQSSVSLTGDTQDATSAVIGTVGRELIVQTNQGAPRGRVVAIDPAHPERAHWRDILPESDDVIDSWAGVTMVSHRLIALYRRDAVLAARVYDLQGKLQYEFTIPNYGSVWSGFSGRPSDTEAFFQVQSVVDPGTLYRLDVASGRTSVFLRPELAYDPSQVVLEQVFYRAQDGTRIPMFVAHQIGTKLDGSAPLWIYGYGALNWTAAPWFQPAMAGWLSSGGIWAVPNTRGGGEYGENWHLAGSRQNKWRAVQDYIDAVEWLIANRYTARGRVVANTSSTGGVLVAAAVVQRPDLFGAAVIEYPAIDVLRYEQYTGGRRWISEYGTTTDSADLAGMLRYAPLQHVSPRCYPSTYVTPGERDQTAAPFHGYKFAAALMDAQQCADHPILLRVSWGAGHAAGATIVDAIENWKDQVAFARHAVGAP